MALLEPIRILYIVGCNHPLEQDKPLGVRANVIGASLPSPLTRRVEQTIASVGGASVGEVSKTGRRDMAKKEPADTHSSSYSV